VGTAEPLGFSRRHYGLRLANRSALLWMTLSERFPRITELHPIAYTGRQPDAFFERALAPEQRP